MLSTLPPNIGRRLRGDSDGGGGGKCYSGGTVLLPVRHSISSFYSYCTYM